MVVPTFCVFRFAATLNFSADSFYFEWNTKHSDKAIGDIESGRANLVGRDLIED